MSDRPAMSGDTTDPAAALVLMVDPPGAGKSTWCSDRFRTEDLFSLDMFRRILAGDVADQAATGVAVSMLDAAVGYRMSRRMLTVVDSCNTRRGYRESFIDAARQFGVPVLAVVMGTPVEVCQERNAARDFAPYPGANGTPVPPSIVSVYAYEARKESPRVGEVDAVLTVAGSGAPLSWEGCLPPAVLSAPWLTDTMGAPWLPPSRLKPRPAPSVIAAGEDGRP